MSQEAEYLLRNISFGQVRDIARRITSHQMASSESRMRQWWQNQLGRLENRLHGEVVGLRAEMTRRHTSLAKDLECNRRMTEALRQQVNLQGEDLACQREAIQVLEQQSRELHSQLEETNQQQTQIAHHLAAVDTRLNADIAERQAERARNASHASALQRLATDGIGRIDGRRVQRMGLNVELEALHGAARRADAVAANPAHSQAAIALYNEALNQVDRILLECNRREMEISQHREIARINLDLAAERLANFATDTEAAEVFAKVIPTLQEEIVRVTGLQKRFSDTENADFSRLLADWSHVSEASRAIADRVEQAWRERDEVLNKIRHRNRTLEQILKALIEVWGTHFEIDEMYAVTDDPRSTLMLQSRRPHGKNVTVHLDLDGRMQISFTGYLGMQCAKDAEEFKRHLEQTGEMQVRQVGSTDHPDKPNPPGVDGPGPIVFKPQDKQQSSTQSRKR